MDKWTEADRETARRNDRGHRFKPSSEPDAEPEPETDRAVDSLRADRDVKQRTGTLTVDSLRAIECRANPNSNPKPYPKPNPNLDSDPDPNRPYS